MSNDPCAISFREDNKFLKAERYLGALLIIFNWERFMTEDEKAKGWKEGAVPAIAMYAETIPDKEGLESLFRDNYQHIFRTAYRITGSTVDAEDVLQTVFLRLVRRTDNRELSPNPTSYLLRATINASLDIMRSRNRSVRFEQIDADRLVSPQLNPEAEQTQIEMKRAVRAALGQLSPKMAEILTLRYFEGYGNQEIAKLLNMSQLVVGVMLHRARTRLRKEIGKVWEDANENV